MTHQVHNLSAGTQVVVDREIYGSNHGLVHPREAVGVITRTPAVAGEQYLVRFPDGFEASMAASDFVVLKHFKDRLPTPDGSLSNFSLENQVIYRCVVGSRAYGLETEDSDKDLRGVYVAPPDLQWSLYGAPDQFEDNEGQWCLWELQKFVVMALKANPNILECLYSPLIERITHLGQELLDIREAFLSQMVFQTFNGYALSQFKKIEQDLRNQGKVKWKHAMHLLRLLLTGATTLIECRVPVRVENARDRLLAVKSGSVAWEEVDAWRKDLHRNFEQALARTSLPKRPDYEVVNRFLIRARRQQLEPL